jgi:hypothetical protein
MTSVRGGRADSYDPAPRRERVMREADGPRGHFPHNGWAPPRAPSVAGLGGGRAQRRANAHEIPALINERKLAHPVVSVHGRHQPTTRSPVGLDTNSLPLAVQSVCVINSDVAGGVGSERVNIWCVPKMELDRAAPDDEVAVLLDRCTLQLEPQP